MMHRALQPPRFNSGPRPDPWGRVASRPAGNRASATDTHQREGRTVVSKLISSGKGGVQYGLGGQDGGTVTERYAFDAQNRLIEVTVASKRGLRVRSNKPTFTALIKPRSFLFSGC